MNSIIPPSIARNIATLAHQHDWQVGSTREQQLHNGWIQTSITSISIYPTLAPTMSIHAHNMILIITTGYTTISIDMRLGASDFTDALSQAFDDISR